MGYDIHIIRSDHWSDIEPEEEISAREWIDYVGSDPGHKTHISATSGTSISCGCE